MIWLMQNFQNGVLVEISKNRLRVLSSNMTKSEEGLEAGVVSDSRVLSREGVVAALKRCIHSLKIRVDKIAFLVAEKDFYDRFFVVRGGDPNITATLRAQASEFVGGSLDDFYCVFQKVSPFVYQFIGVKKEIVDGYLDISERLDLSLIGILPVSFVLAKSTGSFNPFFLVFRGVDESMLVASEYGGVYFSGTYSSSSSSSEELSQKISSLLNELSTFNRDRPVTEVYCFGEPPKLDPKFKVSALSLDMAVDIALFAGFERLLIALSLLEKGYEEALGSYFNLRNYVVTDVAKRSPLSVVKYVVPALVVAGLALFLYVNMGSLVRSLKSTPEPPEVSGSKLTTLEASPSADITPPPPAEATVTPKPLDKKVLRIRIENGAGVAGVAGKAQAFLVSLGYTVSEVGNAENFAYQVTSVRIKDTMRGYLDTLLADLKTTYDTQTGQPLPEDRAFDVLVIIGKK